MTNDCERLKYVVRLLIEHPQTTPSSISQKLGLVPHLANLAGSPRQTPTGAALPGLYGTNKWGYSFRAENEGNFCQGILKMVETLEPHSEFLSHIVNTNGTIDLIVHLPGDVNIGDMISWHVLARLVALKVSLGIEVFPEFN